MGGLIILLSQFMIHKSKSSRHFIVDNGLHTIDKGENEGLIIIIWKRAQHYQRLVLIIDHFIHVSYVCKKFYVVVHMFIDENPLLQLEAVNPPLEMQTVLNAFLQILAL